MRTFFTLKSLTSVNEDPRGVFFSTSVWSFICSVHECRNFSTHWGDRVCSRRQDLRKWMTKWNRRKTFKVFVHTNNRSKPTEKKSIFAIWIHSTLPSNPCLTSASLMSRPSFNFPQRKTRIRWGISTLIILGESAALALESAHNSLGR